MISAILVGYGRFGKLYAARADAAGLDVVAVVDHEAPRRRAIADGYRTFPTLRTAIIAQRPELVIVATPPEFHATLAVESLVGGVDVLLAKPGASSVDEALLVATIARNLGRRVVVDYTPLMSPTWNEIKATPWSGKIATVRMTRRGSARYQSCGVLWDLAPHDVALALDLDPADDVSSVSARAWYAAGFSEPVGAFVFLEHASGRTTRIEVDWVANTSERRVEIVDDELTSVWDQTRDESGGEDNVTRALRRAIAPGTDDTDLLLRVTRIIEAAEVDIYEQQSRATTTTLANLR